MITVLMPVHNGAEFLRAAAESILGQTYRELELLVVNDGSTDRTPDILAELAAADARVRVIGGATRLGFSGALNMGLDQARGGLIARMDADDICLPDRLAVQHAFLSRHTEIGLCGAGVERFGLQRGTFHRIPLTYDETQAYALFDNPFAHPTVMVRRDLLERHHLRYDPSYCPADDYELWSRALRLFSCENIDRVVLKYRVHAQSLTQAEWTDMDGRSARVAARELEALGVAHDEAAVRFHRNVGRGRCYDIRSRAEVDRAEAWLLHLLACNRTAQRYPEAAFGAMAGEVWFRVCMHALSLGRWIVLRYLRSAPALRAEGRGRRTALLAAAVAKSRMRGD